jgi:hypothetical protein
MTRPGFESPYLHQCAAKIVAPQSGSCRTKADASSESRSALELGLAAHEMGNFTHVDVVRSEVDSAGSTLSASEILMRD